MKRLFNRLGRRFKSFAFNGAYFSDRAMRVKFQMEVTISLSVILQLAEVHLNKQQRGLFNSLLHLSRQP